MAEGEGAGKEGFGTWIIAGCAVVGILAVLVLFLGGLVAVRSRPPSRQVVIAPTPIGGLCSYELRTVLAQREADGAWTVEVEANGDSGHAWDTIEVPGVSASVGGVQRKASLVSTLPNGPVPAKFRMTILTEPLADDIEDVILSIEMNGKASWGMGMSHGNTSTTMSVEVHLSR